MKARLALLWERLHGAYWFYPTILLVAGAAAAFTLTALDRELDTRAPTGTLLSLYTGGADGARAMLGAIATAVLGVAGTTFTITVAVLSLTTSQFGPRLLRNFLRDAGNQVVLGIFVATFLYCLLVMRTVRGVEENTFVPHLSISVGVGLAVLSVAVLVYFIHHVVAVIQAPNFIALSGKELLHWIEQLYPEQLGGEPDEEDREHRPGTRGWPLHAQDSGFLQAFDEQRLHELADSAGGVVKLLRAPGDFVAKGSVVASLHGDGVPAEAQRMLGEAMSLGRQTTPVQDITMPVNQLTEIGMRALSSSVNDPNTAITCIGHLSAGLCALAARRFPSACRSDRGRVWLVARAPTFADLLHLAMDPFRRYGAHDARVLIRLLDALEDIGSCATTGTRRDALAALAGEVLEAGRGGLASRTEREQLAARHGALCDSLQGGRPDGRPRPAQPEGERAPPRTARR